MTAQSRKRLFRLAGWLVAAASAIFLATVIVERWAEISSISLSFRQWLVIAGLALVYGVSLFLLAVAWHCLLRLVGSVPLRPAQSIHAYTTAQLAKYVPGNVFHIVGRHLMLRDKGVTDNELAVASAAEIALMLASAGLVVIAAVLVEPPQFLGAYLAPFAGHAFAVFSTLALVAIAIAILVARKFARGSVLWLVAGIAACCAFFAIMGGIVVLLVFQFSATSPLLVAGGGVAAWMAGFVTPGAPAGIGTREAAMLLFVGDRVQPGALVVCAALFRLVTLLGDMICFALGYLLFRRA